MRGKNASKYCRIASILTKQWRKNTHPKRVRILTHLLNIIPHLIGKRNLYIRNLVITTKKDCFAFGKTVFFTINLNQYIPIPPPGAPIGAGFSSGISVTRLSVVSTVAATDAAFCNALLVTLAGSTIPAANISAYSSVSAL